MGMERETEERIFLMEISVFQKMVEFRSDKSLFEMNCCKGKYCWL
jgi:hypothetical protein